MSKLHDLIPLETAKILAGYITEHRELNGGTQVVFKFPNGFGASLIKSPLSYGGDKGLFELEVLDSKGRICYTTEVTDDVLGYLTQEDAIGALLSIKNL